ncbi:MAG: hypothetical protein HYX27_13615 [Acidobacteria bacterium]|nr:hypothetical protein [Acidobacteriota bacterium]
MDKERKAQIARENGAKSKGPVTPEGKDRSRANALKHGQRAQTLRHLANPHPAVLCNEDSRLFFRTLNDLLAHYKPVGPVAIDIVREMAVSRLELTRAQLTKAAAFNRAFIQEQHKPHDLPDELLHIHCTVNSANSLLKISAAYDRTINALHLRLERLERRLRHTNAHFPGLGGETTNCGDEQSEHERTGTDSAEAVENTTESEERPLITDDPSEQTRRAYEYFFPGRELIVIERDPASDVDPDPGPKKPN